jgi:signal transduction histidine kinase
MNNAVKFTKVEGNITLNVSRMSSFYYFSVWDDGIGISLDKLMKITAILQQQCNKIQNPELEFS